MGDLWIYQIQLWIKLESYTLSYYSMGIPMREENLRLEVIMN